MLEGVTRTARRPSRPCALTIAGSDSGGGAGIQADLKTFAALEVHGTSVLTCVTAQNPDAVLAVEALSPELVTSQMTAVFEGLAPASVKTGMLYSTRLIEAVADFLSGRKVALVVDPVMVATSGARLLQPKAVEALRKKLLPLATLVTPNLDEAVLLTGLTMTEPEDLRAAARFLHDRYGCAALIKGGHLDGPEAVDVFWDGREELLLRAARVRGVSSHGTGCTYSAAIAGYLALGCRLAHAVQMAKEYITQAIAQSYRVGRHAVLEHAWTS
jgi:hydroxymethylpyrimidine/phosphomethylpyrimidine kinase